MKRFLHIAAVCLFALTMLGADTSRLDKVGHQLVCQCGCGQILSECNHVGCPVSPVMLKELQQQLDAGLSNHDTLGFFINKYGPIALAAPIRGGFDNVAWIVPIAALLLCTAGVFYLLRVWKRRTVIPAGATAVSLPADSPLQDRIRRETDYDSWSDSQ